jgi:ACS family tartrate transporter-like MFS transporter
MAQNIEHQVMRKIFVRLTPVLMFLYMVAYLDRNNISFASLTMNKDLSIDPYAYGFGAGIFFIAYFFFEVPSNLMLARVGARKWIARIVFSWGIVATLTAFIQGYWSFLVARFLLGAAEAGFFPGVILYLTYWFPARYRARIVANFMLALPVSLAIGAPLSTWIMQLDGTFGLKGWQWLFLCEGIPAILSTFLALGALSSNPAEVSWLNEDEKRWLESELKSDREAVAVEKTETRVAGVFTNPKILVFCLIYVSANAATQGTSLFLPQIIKQQGFSIMQTGLITSLPYIAAAIGMIIIGRHSDRLKERKWHTIACFVTIAIGLGTAGFLGYTIPGLAVICLAQIGIWSVFPVFWPMASAYMSGYGAAAGLALINSVGNLGGFFGPFVVGYATQMTNTFRGGFYALALLATLSAILTFFNVKVSKRVETLEIAKTGN